MAFANAGKIAAAPKAAAKKAKQTTEVRGVEELAMVSALAKNLEAIAATLSADVKAQALARFMEHIKEKGTKPESFRGTEGNASASLEFRKKAANHPLSPEQVEILRAHSIEPERVDDIPELYAINPKYAGNPELMDKAEQLLRGALPDDFIVLQEARSKFIVSDATLAAACAGKLDAEVIQCVATLAVKPKLDIVNMPRILEFVSGLMMPVATPSANTEAQQIKAAS